jgi:hypothetical protein
MILGRRSFVLFVGKRRCRNKDNRIQQFRILNPAKFGRAVLRNIPATYVDLELLLQLASGAQKG